MGTRLRLVAASAVTILGIAILATPLRDKLAGGIGSDPTGRPAIPARQAGALGQNSTGPVTIGAPPPPMLARSRAQVARKTLTRSVALRRLLHGAPYRIVEEGPWVAADGKTPLGVVFMLQLRRPAFVSGAWPAAHFFRYGYVDPGHGFYASREAHFAYKGVTQLMAEVNRSSTAVVNIVPFSGQLVKGSNR